MNDETGTETAAQRRRKAIDQALKRWPKMERAERFKLAKAYAMDAIQQHGVGSHSFSSRLESGLNLLREALLDREQCSACHGTGVVPRDMTPPSTSDPRPRRTSNRPRRG